MEFDRDQDGSLDPAERASARIVIYGLSFGGAATVKLARDLGFSGSLGPIPLHQCFRLGGGEDIPARAGHPGRAPATSDYFHPLMVA